MINKIRSLLITGRLYFNDSDRTADPKNRFKKYAHAHAVPSNKAKLVYTVKSGDVIGKIAEKFNVRLSDLKYWNGMTRDRINIGQKLTVYVPNNKVDYYKSKVDAKYAGLPRMRKSRQNL